MSNPFIVCPSCTEDRKKLKAILCDVFPNEKIKTNTILAAYDAGILEALNRAKELNELIRVRFVKILLEDYGIGKQHADWAVAYWFEKYGNECLKKTIVVSENRVAENTASKKAVMPRKREKKETTVTNTNKTQSLDQTTSQPILVKSLKEKQKIPKDLFVYHRDIEKQWGVNHLDCSIRLDNIYNDEVCARLKFTGEYEAAAKDDVIVIVRIYNEKNEMIAAHFGLEIRTEDKGRKPFSEYIDVLKNERIAKVDVRVTPDPLFK